jgi:hypothetical protein
LHSLLHAGLSRRTAMAICTKPRFAGSWKRCTIWQDKLHAAPRRTHRRRRNFCFKAGTKLLHCNEIP